MAAEEELHVTELETKKFKEASNVTEGFVSICCPASVIFKFSVRGSETFQPCYFPGCTSDRKTLQHLVKILSDLGHQVPPKTMVSAVDHGGQRSYYPLMETERRLAY